MKLKRIYLAIPYRGMEESSFSQANEASVAIINSGHNVFSPITHSHPLTKLGKISVPSTWDYWKNIDFQFIDWADELWVLIPKEGAEYVVNSEGVTEECIYATQNKKPIKYFTVSHGKIINDHIENYYFELKD